MQFQADRSAFGVIAGPDLRGGRWETLLGIRFTPGLLIGEAKIQLSDNCCQLNRSMQHHLISVPFESTLANDS
jgi:hypothetical protein